MDKVELEKRTKRFALKIIEFVATLPQTKACSIIEYQLVKAGTSVGRIIARPTERNRAQTLFIRLALWRKKRQRAVFGLRSVMKPTWETSKSADGF
jgi:hypothetical protein